MARALVLLAALLMTSGCMDDTGTTSSTSSTSTSHDPGPPPKLLPWKSMACDPTGVTQTAQNADRIHGLKGSADDIARRIGDALGDPVTGEAKMFEDTAIPSWPTQKGFINIQMGARLGGGGDTTKEEQFLVAYYQGNRTWTPDRAAEIVRSLGADESHLRSSKATSSGQLWQEWDSIRLRHQYLGAPGASWLNGTNMVQFSLGQFFTFSSERYNVTQDEAVDTGKAFMRCTLDKAGLTESKGYTMRDAVVQGVSVINTTVTWAVHVDYGVPKDSPCGNWDSRWVFVDAWTGAVKFMAFAPCA